VFRSIFIKSMSSAILIAKEAFRSTFMGRRSILTTPRYLRLSKECVHKIVGLVTGAVPGIPIDIKRLVSPRCSRALYLQGRIDSYESNWRANLCVSACRWEPLQFSPNVGDRLKVALPTQSHAGRDRKRKGWSPSSGVGAVATLR